jgi:transposase
MLNSSAAKIYLCLEPTDMRKSFDTLAAVVREHLQGDPLSGTWFVFRGKQGNRLKILYWDGDGYALWLKRLEQGTFEFPKVIGEAAGVSITATELSLILGGVALSAKRRPRYAKPEKSSATSEIPSHV